MKREFSQLKNLLLVLLILLFAGYSNAQSWKKESSLHFGLFLGGSNYIGELTEGVFPVKGTHPSIGLITRYHPGPRIAFRLSGNYGKISGDDDWYNSDDKQIRNLRFRSNIWDFTAAFELNLNILDYKQEKGVVPYIFAGVSVFNFNPQAQFNYADFLLSEQQSRIDPAQREQILSNLEQQDGEWIELQPLSTEGQVTTEYNDRDRYSLTQLAIPFGAGVRFVMNKHWTIGLEYGIRKTFTDYLDDVSTTYATNELVQSHYGYMASYFADRSNPLNTPGAERGNADNKDWYSIFGFQLTYKILSNKDKCFQF